MAIVKWGRVLLDNHYTIKGTTSFLTTMKEGFSLKNVHGWNKAVERGECYGNQ